MLLKLVLDELGSKVAAKVPVAAPGSPMPSAAFGGVDAAAGFGRGVGAGQSADSQSDPASAVTDGASEGPVETSPTPLEATGAPAYQPTVYSNVPSGFWVWLELSTARIRELARLSNSVLFCPFVYPALQVSIAPFLDACGNNLKVGMSSPVFCRSSW